SLRETGTCRDPGLAD
ncbi:hypothetical protein CEXT_454911, partial [Caerostris extrusa]